MPEPDPNSFWTWVIPGCEGVIRLLEGAASEGLRNYPDRADEVERLAERLRKVSIRMRDNPQ